MLSLFRIAVGAVVAFMIAWGAVPASAAARELATAQGTIAISDARPPLRAPSCSELVVEARDALDNHLISETQPTPDENGACRYVLSVPAQTAVWLRVQPMLVAGARVVNGANAKPATSEPLRAPTGSVAIRSTIISPATYFFAPSELKTLQLRY